MAHDDPKFTEHEAEEAVRRVLYGGGPDSEEAVQAGLDIAVQAGLMERVGDRYRLTAEGRAEAERVMEAALDAPPPRADADAHMCADCAYRPGSPERVEDPHAAVQGLDELHHLAATGRPFYCHAGMRLVLAWHHPSGAVITGETGEYDPPIRAGVPYQADGTPGLVCGGWAAVRRRHDTEPPTGETLRDGSPARGCGRAGAHGPEGGSLSPRAAERAGDRTSRAVAVASHPEHAGGDP